MRKSKTLAVFWLLVLIFMGSPAASTPQSAPQGQAVTTLQQFLDQVLLMVAPIEQWCGPSRLGTATGFFFTNEGKLYLITNRHVVRDDEHRIFPDKLRLRLHTNAQDNTQNADYDVPLYRNRNSVWREKAGVDLVAIELPPLEMSHFVLVALASNFLPPGNLVIAPGDEVLIVGYPRGFSDVLHNYPIVRIGAVASAYPIPFQGQPLFLVDARLHPGTSGSPVLAKPSNMLRTATGTVFGDYSIFFLGVNSGEFNFSGESSGLNAIWYGAEVVALTASSYHSPVFQQP
jgi:S1-C subfamily serine protease